jgi:hypothetical protein
MSYSLYKRSSWLPATATWYGSPDGDGSDGKLLNRLITRRM